MTAGFFFIYLRYVFIWCCSLYAAERTVQNTLLSYVSQPLPLPFSASFYFSQLLKFFEIQHGGYTSRNVVSHT